jgi:D-alanyl-D-alanine dipeptidase
MGISTKKVTLATLFILVFAQACATTSENKTEDTREGRKEEAVKTFSARSNDSPDIIALQEIDPTIVQEIRYATSHNFVGRPMEGYTVGRCLLTRQAAEALAKVQAELKAQSMSLKVYDCYRPQRAVDDFVAWANDLGDLKMKDEFYPKVDKTNLFKDGYIAKKSGHTRGSTVDLTVVPVPVPGEASYKKGQPLAACTLPTGQRFEDNSVDMGTGYDCFDPLAHTNNLEVGPMQRANRLLLKQLMEKYGFKGIATEWWHYTLVNEPYPDQYFDFEIK